MKKRYFVYLFLVIFLTSVVSAGSMPIYVKPLDGDGSLNPNTAYTYTFNWTTDSSCNNVVFSNSSISITTGDDGIGFVNLTIPDSPSSNPSYLCEYRDGSLRKTHTLSSQLFNSIFTDSVTLTPSLSISASSEGTLFYNSSTQTLQVYNGSKWLGLSGVPEGTISAFENSCPTGWTEHTGNNKIETADAWVNFNGTSCASNGDACTIYDSFNVKNVTRFTSARYLIYFENEFQNTDYSFAGSAPDASGSNTQTILIAQDGGIDKQTNMLPIVSSDPDASASTSTSTNVEVDRISVIAFGNSTNQLTYCKKVGQDSLESESFWGKLADKLFVQNTSLNVGIGTTSPSSKLTLQGDGSVFDIQNSTGDSKLFVNTTSGNVGIGTASPGAKLEVRDGGIVVNKSDFTNIDIFTRGAESDEKRWRIRGLDTSSGAFQIGTRADNDAGGSFTPALTFTRNGLTPQYAYFSGVNVGIGDASPAGLFDVGNDFLVNDGHVEAFLQSQVSSSNVCFTNTGSIEQGSILGSCSSSRRYKENIKDIEFSIPALQIVSNLRPVSFNSKKTGEEGIGMIAEEVEKLDKRFVFYKEGKIEGINYDTMTATVLTKAIQELNEKHVKEIEELREENNLLKSELCSKDNTYSWC